MKKFLIINLFFIFSFFLFAKKIFAQVNISFPTASPTNLTNQVNYQVNYKNSSELLIELLKILFSFQGISTETGYGDFQNLNLQTSISISPLPSSFPELKITPDINGYVYYSQCRGNFDNTPLPNGGTLCQAGCGPTTVAMILSSFVNNSFNPLKVVDEYKNRGYYLGKDGSYYYDAKSILNSYGLKTAIIYAGNPLTINQLINKYGIILKNYQNSGWTFFALANYCENDCGHYFWIINIDDGLNTWSYDPYYGIGKPRPYNEKERYPFPKYRVIFGVKK